MSDMEQLLRHVGAATIYALLGVVIFAGAFKVMVAMAPFSVKKEIGEDQNVALAIVMGSVILGLAVVVAAAVQG
jgi:uncharacterized membrane protein YjfL (UPF0719 family)